MLQSLEIYPDETRASVFDILLPNHVKVASCMQHKVHGFVPYDYKEFKNKGRNKSSGFAIF